MNTLISQRLDDAAAVIEARAFGAEIIEVGQHGDGAAYVYLKDPDGYVIEIGT